MSQSVGSMVSVFEKKKKYQNHWRVFGAKKIESIVESLLAFCFASEGWLRWDSPHWAHKSERWEKPEPFWIQDCMAMGNAVKNSAATMRTNESGYVVGWWLGWRTGRFPPHLENNVPMKSQRPKENENERHKKTLLKYNITEVQNNISYIQFSFDLYPRRWFVSQCPPHQCSRPIHPKIGTFA